MSVIPSVAQLCKFAKLFPCVLSMWYTISLMQIGEIVGAWLSNYRAEKKLTLEQIADASQRYGSGWAASTVSRMEKGSSKGDSLTALIILLATLNDLTGDDLTLADVFTDYAGTVDLGDYATSYENITSALQGEKVAFTYASKDKLEHTVRSIATFKAGAEDIDLEAAMRKISIHWSTHDYIAPTATPKFTPSFTRKKHYIISNHYPTAAEQRLETRLRDANEDLFGTPTKVWAYTKDAHLGLAVAAICDVLYGHSLDEEAAKRAGEGATPQKRGRVTRVLAGEILDYMRKVAAKLED